MRRWQEAGEEARVRRQCQRRHRRGLIEDHALAAEPVEMRQCDVHEAVRRQPIGSRRVKRDEEHRSWRSRRARASRAEGREQRSDREQQRFRHRCSTS